MLGRSLGRICSPTSVYSSPSSLVWMTTGGSGSLPPWGPPSEAVYDFLGTVHGVTAIVFCILIAGHVLAALKHALIDRDRVFSRML